MFAHAQTEFNNTEMFSRLYSTFSYVTMHHYLCLLLRNSALKLSFVERLKWPKILLLFPKVSKFSKAYSKHV